MGFLAANAMNRQVKEANNLQSTAGAWSLFNQVQSDNAFNDFNDQLTKQINGQIAQIDQLTGPQASYFGPTPIPGIGSTGPSGDTSAPNLGRASLFGS